MFLSSPDILLLEYSVEYLKIEYLLGGVSKKVTVFISGYKAQELLGAVCERVISYSLACDVLEHDTDTGDAEPIRQPPRRPPLSARQAEEDILNEMLQTGVFEPSNSPWLSPVCMKERRQLQILRGLPPDELSDH